METAIERGLAGVVPFRFACHRCGHCCSGGEGFVWLEEGECERLAAALGLPLAAFVDRHVRRVPDPRDGRPRLALREAADAPSGGRCSLLEGRNTCRAYSARPRHCAEFPYWDGVLRDPAAFEAARATCPGIAVVVPQVVRERAHAELALLYAELGGPRVGAACCLDRGRDELHATGLEADYAAAHARPTGACRLGPGAPIACRIEDGEEGLARVRSIERRTGYPAAYGRLADLLRGRGFALEGGGA
ncbi:MAG: YkgJ family cysteine cluster protein [Planctomycetes bacterium]|nr:YkgJ family cysteine cluster protein [Planctomycetota bacterium]